MIRFECDYNNGAHPAILEALCATNNEQTPGYGEDDHCENARRLIRKDCEAPGADVHFLVGGTQANTVVISSILRPHQGVLSAATGHIACHETGAIEATGHKVIPLPGKDGKLTAAEVQKAYDNHWSDATHEHIVQPGMVYISHPTENGTIYTKAELAALSETCHKLGLPLFMDGARMGYGLVAPGGDATLADIARLVDVFYIGGTKVGALFGEAVVITNDALKADFRYFIKQRGGMLAKGRLLGIQFETLFTDGLYCAISKHAVDAAGRLRKAFTAKDVAFRYDSPTNQLFPILPNEVLARLEKKYAFSFWEKAGPGQSVVRFCTSWATANADVDALIADIEAFL